MTADLEAAWPPAATDADPAVAVALAPLAAVPDSAAEKLVLYATAHQALQAALDAEIS